MILRSLMAVLLAAVVFPSISNAQRFEYFAKRQTPVQRWNRGMGIWHGAGRHWRNPGHDSSYYNAWSPHNSALVTRGHYPPNLQYPMYTPSYDADPFYTPGPPPTPKKPAAAPLGGSYEEFDDEDVDEQVPEIDPVEGKPAERKDGLDLDRLRIEEQTFLPDQNYDLPNDALIYSTQSRVREQWENIK